MSTKLPPHIAKIRIGISPKPDLGCDLCKHHTVQVMQIPVGPYGFQVCTTCVEHLYTKMVDPDPSCIGWVNPPEDTNASA